MSIHPTVNQPEKHGHAGQAGDLLTLDVNVFDTDCFGVMWHGAYTKWLEVGRVQYLAARGVRLSRPGDPDGYIYPVAEQSFRFRAPARYQDCLIMETRLEMTGAKLVFSQVIRHAETRKLILEAQTTCVIVDAQWTLQRKLPDAVSGLRPTV